MRLPRTSLLITATLALCLSLTACGGTSGTTSSTAQSPEPVVEEDPAAAFVGSWEFAEGEFGGDTYTEEDYDAMAELGVHVMLNLDDQGNACLSMAEEAMDGTWEVTGTDEATLDLGGDVTMSIGDDGRMTLANDEAGEYMVFEKTSDTPDMSAADSADSGKSDLPEGFGDGADDSGDGSADEGTVSDDGYRQRFDSTEVAAQDLYAMGVTQTAPLGVVVADDDTAGIAITGIGEDFEGDTGYLMQIENRTDQDLYIENLETTLDDADVYDEATVARVIPAGTTKTAFFFFDRGTCTVTEASSCEFALGLFTIDQDIVALYTGSV